jgi:2'-5' RNA ligase
MRLFIAVNLSTEARDAIQTALDHFPVKDPPWRWVGPENWHLTLKFLGEVDPARAVALAPALEQIARGHRAFAMSLGAFGGFPNLGNPRVLFYNIERGAPELESLADDVDAALEKVPGLDRERRRFHAHATVARVKDALPPDIIARFARVPALTDAVTRVDGFNLMESRLRRTGAIYSVVKEFAMA